MYQLECAENYASLVDLSVSEVSSMSTTGRLCNAVKPDGEGLASTDLQTCLVTLRTGATLVVCHMATKKRRKASRLSVPLREGARYADTLRISPIAEKCIKAVDKLA